MKKGRNVEIFPGAIIGEGCTIGHNCTIFPGAVIGNRVKLEGNTDVFSGVTIENDVFVGPSVVFTNDLTPRAFHSKNGVYRPTLIKRGASIGANATIVCGITIGEYAAVGAGSVVTREVPDHVLVIGNPAVFKTYICSCNGWGKLVPAASPHKWECSTCGATYVKQDDSFTPVGD